MRSPSAVVFCLIAGRTCSLTAGRTIHVNSTDDSAEEMHPIQAAIELAMPGDTVLIHPGLYAEDISSYRDGTADEPITIKGSASAILHGESAESIVVITHDHIHLEGFSIKGFGDQYVDAEEEWTYHGNPESYSDTLLHVQGKRVRLADYEGHVHRSAVMGFKATNLAMSHARGTCMKLSYFITHASIHGNSISDCGKSVHMCEESSSEDESCGAGLSLGTPLPHRMEGIGGEVDECAWNSFTDNVVSDMAGPCFTLHRGSRANLVDSNICEGSMDAEAAGIVVNGIANTLRDNEVTNAAGAALAVGQAEAEEVERSNDDPSYYMAAIFNEIYNNQLLQLNAKGSLLNGVLPLPSGKVCSNVVDVNVTDILGHECADESDDSAEDDGSGSESTESSRSSSSGGSGGGTSSIASGRTGSSSSSDDDVVKPIESSRTSEGVVEGFTCIPATVESGGVTSSLSQEWEEEDIVYNAEIEGTVSPGEVVIDDNDDSFWSGYGKGQWINFDFDHNHAVEPPSLLGVSIKFYRGRDRVYHFKVTATDASNVGGEGTMWTDIISNAKSSGEGDGPEVFLFPGGAIKKGIVRYVGLGSMQNDGDGEETFWTSIESITWCEGTPVESRT